ncbi:MAG: PEGA domain-containing protein [Patescibacteria group bacterium]|jgi:hypothetical protein
MNLNSRRYLVIILTLIFVIIAPTLILYGLGYKYDWAKKRLEKTGVFFIKSFPKGADIYLEGIKLKKKTPNQITRLLPKTYEVKIAQEGFRPWLKNLAIEPQITTFIEDVSLFYQQPEIKTLAKGSFTDFLTSQNLENIALIEKGKDNKYILWFYNPNNESFSKLYESTKNLQLLSWSDSGQKILLQENSDYLVVNKNQPDLVYNLNKIYKTTFDQLKWDALNDNLLYGLKNQQLGLINLNQKNYTTITTDKIIDFLPYKNGVLCLNKTFENLYLKIYLPNEERLIFTLPSGENYQFSNLDGQQIALNDQNQKQLYIINPNSSSQPISSILKNASGFSWHDQALIYWDNSELWAFYPVSNQKILLERTVQKISKAFWHPNIVYIYAVIGNKLKLYELDSRDQRNIYDILSVLPGEENFIAPNKKGDAFFAITTIDNTPGFYKFILQP